MPFNSSSLSGPLAKRAKVVYPRRRKRLGATLRVPRPFKAPGDQVITVERTFRDTNIIGASLGVLDNGGYQGCAALTFKLSDCYNSQDITNMFDEYRIVKAEITFSPRYIDNTTATGDNNIATLGWFQDHTDVSLTGYTQHENPWLERQGYRQSTFDKPVRVSVYPRPLEMVYLNTSSTGYQTATGSNKWLACTQASVPYYGLFYRLYKPFATAADTQGMVSAYIKLTIQCRQTK